MKHRLETTHLVDPEYAQGSEPKHLDRAGYIFLLLPQKVHACFSPLAVQGWNLGKPSVSTHLDKRRAFHPHNPIGRAARASLGPPRHSPVATVTSQFLCFSRRPPANSQRSAPARSGRPHSPKIKRVHLDNARGEMRETLWRAGQPTARPCVSGSDCLLI